MSFKLRRFVRYEIRQAQIDTQGEYTPNLLNSDQNVKECDPSGPDTAQETMIVVTKADYKKIDTTKLMITHSNLLHFPSASPSEIIFCYHIITTGSYKPLLIK